MASSGGDDAAKRKAIVIIDMPVEFINREILKTHFEKFGTVERLACSISKKYAVVHFSTQAEAENARTNGTRIKPDATPLKIFFTSGSSTATNSAGQKATIANTSTARVITRRKIIRNFPHSDTLQSSVSLHSPASEPEPLQESENKSVPSVSTNQQFTFKSAKSRTPPVLRKKPSFGDSARCGKPMGGPVTRNPFSLPPRNMLSLDRRKISPKAIASITSSSIPEDDKTPTSTNIQPIVDTKPSSELSEENKPSTFPKPDHESAERKIPTQVPTHGLDDEILTDQIRTTVDIDETTEDAPVNEELIADEDTPDNMLDEENTQDTAEATTEEEEGEIIGDDEEGMNDEFDDNDAYESPLKRFETSTTSTNASTTPSGGAFSFKLPTKNTSDNAGSSSSFNLPFTSPFALGNASKPFSSSSLGIPMSFPKTSIPIASAGTFQAVPEKSEVNKPKLKDKPIMIARKVEPLEGEKTKPFTVDLFSAQNALKSGGTKPVASAVDVKPSPLGVTKFGSSSFGTASNTIQNPSLPYKRLITTPIAQSTAAASSTAGTSQTSLQQNKDAPNPLLLTFNPDTVEAQELFAKRSNTVEERYRILEARDKLIRAKIPKTKVNVELASKLIGTCPDMCPEKERYMRQFQRQLVAYETLPGPEIAVNHQRAIKVYSRSSADQEEPLPHELRPGPTLDYTMHYLLQNIVPLGDSSDENLSDWYHFLWDRTRSIRKDITQQQILDLTAVSLYEKCARFHIHCGSRLCELDVHSFDPKLNDENLTKCLQSLEHLYDDLRRKQVTCPNEPEFRAYQIMMNLNEGDALYNAQQLPSWILNSTVVQTALKLHHNIFSKNFVGFFKTVMSLPYMTACILHRYFFQLRSHALRCFVKSHCTLPKYETAIPMIILQRMLGYGQDEIQSFSYLCEAHGIHCDAEDNKVILKRKLFYLPELPSIYRENHLIDSKLRTSVAEAINGAPLPRIDFDGRKPHSSFNDNGQLVSGAIIASSGYEIASRSFGNNQAEPTAAPVLQTSAISFSQNSFSTGFPFQRRKEVPPPPVAPSKDIENACQLATAKLIDESVRQDVTLLSKARLEEAKRIKEKAARRKILEDLSSKISQEYLEKLITQHVSDFVRRQSMLKIIEHRIVEEVAQQTTSLIVEESVIVNASIAARTELILAREKHRHRIKTLEGIFYRLRQRFALEKWTKFTKAKKLEREMQEEKLREVLWNFPVSNPFGLTTKDVFDAFCGKSCAQPCLTKTDGDKALKNFLETSPVNLNSRLKRKSEGDYEPHNRTSKHPRTSLQPHEIQIGGNISNSQYYDRPDFPAVAQFNKTNRDVLQAFCGPSALLDLQLSAKMTTVTPTRNTLGKSYFNRESSASEFPFVIRRQALSAFSMQKGLTDDAGIIKDASTKNTSDLLNNITNFVGKLREENQTYNTLESEMQNVKDFHEKNLTDDDIKSFNNSLNNSAANDCINNFGEEIMDIDEEPPGIFSNMFTESASLLHNIKRFTRNVRDEYAKSWDVDTFLNNINLDVV